MKVKSESEVAQLCLTPSNPMDWPHYFMANTRGKGEAVTDFLFLGSKITEDGDCSQDIRRRLLLGRKAMTNLDSVLKSKDVNASLQSFKGQAKSLVRD